MILCVCACLGVYENMCVSVCGYVCDCVVVCGCVCVFDRFLSLCMLLCVTVRMSVDVCSLKQEANCVEVYLYA